MKRGVSVEGEEPNPYKIERQRNIEWNKQVLHQLCIVCLAAQIKGARPRNEDLCIGGSGDNDMIERTKLDKECTPPPNQQPAAKVCNSKP